MKKILLFGAMVGSLLALSTSFAANTTIAVFNLQQVLQNDPAVKIEAKKLQKTLRPTNKTIIAARKNLIAEINKLRKMPLNNLNARKKIDNKVIAKREELRGEAIKFQRDLLIGRRQALVKILREIRSVARTIAKKQGYSIVTTDVNMAYVDPNINITKQVITALNKKY